MSSTIKQHMANVLNLMAYANSNNMEGVYTAAHHTLETLLADTHGRNMVQRIMARFAEIVGAFDMTELEEAIDCVLEEDAEYVLEQDALDAMHDDR